MTATVECITLNEQKRDSNDWNATLPNLLQPNLIELLTDLSTEYLH